jgi:hypothetical protein
MNNIPWILIILSIYINLPLIMMIFLNKIFYRQNKRTLLTIMAILSVIYLVIFILTSKYTVIMDSLIFLVPIVCVIILKGTNNLFIYWFKEPLLNTFNFFQFEMPIQSSIWTHRVYNAIVVSLVCIIPTALSFLYLAPSKEFFQIILEGKTYWW